MSKQAMGAYVRQRRIELGLSQAELAERLGVWQTHVSAIEIGRVSPSVETLVRLADALGVAVGDITSAMAEEVVA